jgi:cobalt-zinc-cadmium resistance protein CzcA
MNNLNKLTTAGICLLTSVTGSAAGVRMTLQECIDSALVRNEKMQIASLAVSKATALKGTAFDAAPTAITLQQETTGSAGLDNGVSFSQDFDFPTVYVAKHKALKAQEQLEQSNYAITRNETVRDVTMAYYTLLYQRELLRINQAQDSLYRQFANVANSRYTNGECSKLEPMNAERLVNTTGVALLNVENDYNTAQRRLMYLLNSDAPIEPADTQFSAIAGGLTTSTLNFDATPQGIAAENEIAVSKQNLSVARQQYLPGITLGATTQAMIKSFNPYNVERNRFEKGNFMGFEVGVTVPIFFGAQRARTKAAKKELEMSQLRQDVARKEAENEYAAEMNKLKSASQNLAYYTNTGASQANEIIRIANVSYSLGDINYMEYINNLETAYEMQRNHADAIYEYNQTIINLNYLTGQE